MGTPRGCVRPADAPEHRGTMRDWGHVAQARTHLTCRIRPVEWPVGRTYTAGTLGSGRRRWCSGPGCGPVVEVVVMDRYQSSEPASLTRRRFLGRAALTL